MGTERAIFWRMGRKTSLGGLFLATLLVGRGAFAQATACQGVYGDRFVTAEVFQKSTEVSHTLLTTVTSQALAASDQIASGILSEMQGRRDPDAFRAALLHLQREASSLSKLDTLLEGLLAAHKKDKTLPVFDDALGKLLRENPHVARARLRGARYSRVAGQAIASELPSPRDLTEIIGFQRTDVAVLQKQLARTIEALRRAIPLAEEGRFAAASYSGSTGFLFELHQAIDLLETYRTFYLETCHSTVAATIQVYPAGFQWLEESHSARGADR